MNKSWTMIPLAILKQRKKEIVFFSITVSFLLFSISKALIIFLGQTNDAHETHMYTNLTNNGDCKLFGKWLLILVCLFYDVHGPYHSSIDLTFPVFSHVWYFIYYHHSFKLWGVPPHIREAPTRERKEGWRHLSL